MSKTIARLTLMKVLDKMYQSIGAFKVYPIEEGWLLSELAAMPDVVYVDSVISFEKEIDNEQTNYILLSSDLVNQDVLEKILKRHQRGCAIFYGAV